VVGVIGSLQLGDAAEVEIVSKRGALVLVAVDARLLQQRDDVVGETIETTIA